MQFSRRLGRASAVSVTTLALALGGLASSAPASAVSSPAQSDPPTAVSTDLPSAYASEGSRSVTLSSRFKGPQASNARRAKVTRLPDGDVRIVLFGVRQATVGTAEGTAFRTPAKRRAWSALGDAPKGVVFGVTKKGQRVRTPVVFERVRFVRGTKVVIRATPTSGAVADIAAPYVPNIQGVKAKIRRGPYRQISVTGFPQESENWTWSDNGRRGNVRISGSTIRVTMPKSHARAMGVQPGGEAGSAAWRNLSRQWARYVDEGAAPSLVVTGIQRNRQVRTAVAEPTKLMRRANGTVVVEAVLAPREPGRLKQRPPAGKQRALYLTIRTPGSGNSTSYVAVAGDSIASGEGARYGGTYINPALQVNSSGSGTPTAEDTANRLKLFCDSVDLACTEATVGADGKVSYVADPGLVYEEGSWEDAATGQACHRSKTAPGTWLARYYSTQLGLDVEPITLACSGATTDNIVDTPFKGEAPQSQDLAALSTWLPISHVVATIGANDIRFGEIATACLLAPVNALLGGDEPSGDIDPVEVLAGISRIFDDVRRGADGSVQSINPAFDPANLCSETQRPIVQQAVAEVRGKVTRAMQALHEAAPDAEVVLTNYPSLVPASTHTYFPRQEWFDTSFRPVVLSNGPDGAGEPDCSVDPRPEECGDLGEYLAPWRVALENAGASYWPSPDFFDSDPRAEEPFVDGVLGGNVMNRLIAQNIYPGSTTESGQQLLSNDFGDQVIQSWGFSITPLANILGYGATQFGFDQDWASKEVVPSLNRAVVAGLKDADPSGAWSTPVDMTQVLNGRELGGKYVGHQVGPFDAVWKVDTSSYPPPTLGAGPTASRAQMVTNVFSGQQVPFVCPGPESVAGATGPACVGDLQEALHPNWRGQAAQGQCIVAVVTGAFGESGNACVRSIGDGTATGRTYAGTVDDLVDPTLFTDVPGEDTLCLTDLDSAYTTETGQYQPCTSSVPADPTWDTERWDQGKVTWDGQKVHWR